MTRPRSSQRRSMPTLQRVGRVAAIVAAVLLVAGCTDDGSDVRSPAPTGSLTPATSAEASPSP